jgi:hypothetical protein
MTAVGYISTSGDTRKVSKTGDAMTGDLVLNDSSPDTSQSAASKAFVLAAVAGGATGVASDTVVSETTSGQLAAAGVSSEYSRGDHTHGTPAASGGGSTIRTATVRLTDDNLSGLPAAGSWTVVQTSAGTQLKCSIDASPGTASACTGQLHAHREPTSSTGSSSTGGTIAVYATTGHRAVPAEGNPTMYPVRSFSARSPDMFTVASGHINAGQVTVALAHQGAGYRERQHRVRARHVPVAAAAGEHRGGAVMTDVIAGSPVTVLAQFFDFSGGSLTDLDATPTITVTSIATGRPRSRPRRPA